MTLTPRDRRPFVAGNAPRQPRPALGWQRVARVSLLAALGIACAAWALVRHYTRQLPPMLVPAAPRAPGPFYDADAGEVPAPEIELAP